LAFAKISKECTSLIIASGTLSPLDSFSSELGVAFPNKLEAQHIIDMNEQLVLACLPVSKNGTSLNGSFKNVDSLTYQDAIGESVYNISKNVPGGVLCFVTSYNLLDKLITRWKATEQYQLLSDAKTVFTGFL
jgi:Fanconi anemia group J protein